MKMIQIKKVLKGLELEGYAKYDNNPYILCRRNVLVEVVNQRDEHGEIKENEFTLQYSKVDDEFVLNKIRESF